MLRDRACTYGKKVGEGGGPQKSAEEEDTTGCIKKKFTDEKHSLN